MVKIDWKILAELEGDARLSFSDLSQRVGLSKSPCWSRVRDLEAEGVIRRFNAWIDPAALDLTVQWHVAVRIRFEGHADFEAAAVAHTAAIECHTTAGDSDYLLRIYARRSSTSTVCCAMSSPSYRGSTACRSRCASRLTRRARL